MCKQRLGSVGFDGKCEQGVPTGFCCIPVLSSYVNFMVYFTPVISWTVAITTVRMIAIRLLPSAIVVAERLYFHRCLSVHEGGRCTPLAGRHPHWADTLLAGRHPSDRQTPPPPAGRHPRVDTPRRRPLQRTIRILLECILVFKNRNSLKWVFICDCDSYSLHRKES